MSALEEKLGVPAPRGGTARAKLYQLLARWGRVETHGDKKQPKFVVIVSMDPRGELWERESKDTYVQRELELMSRLGLSIGVPAPTTTN